jgi:hypothetical protein
VRLVHLLPAVLSASLACSSETPPDADCPESPTCPPNGETAELAARAEALRGEGAERRRDGASFEAIAAELAARPEVSEALASDGGSVEDSARRSGGSACPVCSAMTWRR